MNFIKVIEELLKENNIDLFVDMDGVIACYDFGKAYDFDKKRPLKTNIEKLKQISKLDGIKLHILSICRKDSQVKEKNDWLDINAPFFEKERRFILSKETILNTSSANMKLNFLRDYKTNNQKVLLDDDNRVLKTVGYNLENIIVFQDSELID